MENNQSIGDIKNSILNGVNINSQIMPILNIIEIQSKDIDDLRNKMENIKTERYSYWMLLLKIFGFSVLFFVIAVLLKKIFDFEISNDSIVITFVGIMATFIVISNYLQVKEVKDKFDINIKELNTNSINRDTKTVESINSIVEIINSTVPKKVFDLLVMYRNDSSFILEQIEKINCKLRDLENNKKN